MQLNFSDYQFKIRREAGKQFIFDIVRKKFIALTPEEEVRQHLIHYFIYSYKFPKALLSVEKKITLHGMTKRTDLVLYNRLAKPVMLVECKAPEVPINQLVFDQAGRYNLVLQVPYLMVSNGNTTLCACILFEDKTFRMLDSLPSADQLLSI